MYHQEKFECQPQKPEVFKLEGVIVCVNYDDFLAATLPLNKPHFDRLVVVTSPEDIATQKLCEFYHVECVVTDKLRSVDGKFCKGAGINAGLARLALDGWALHLDADVVLPPQTRRLLERANLRQSMLYGCDRFIVPNRKAWDRFCQAPVIQHELDVYIHLNAFLVGTRFMHPQMNGYIPIGFFQLWNPRGSMVRRYPEGHTAANREDMLFANQWARARRGFLPEIVVYHLESEPAPQGANWEGRTTARFE